MFKETVMSSLKWSAIGRFSSQSVTWVITIIVIGLLTPADYGTMAFASMVVSFFAVFEELGLSAALVNTKNLSEELIGKIFGIVVIIAAFVYLVIFAVAPLAASFFAEEELTLVIRVLGIGIPVSALGAVPLALIQRELRFKEKSLVDFTAAITGSVVTLVLALLGWAVWALVLGSLALNTIRTAGYWLTIRKAYIPSFKFDGVRNELQFGGLISVDRLLYIVYSQADTFFIGKFLGKEALGIYSVAMQLATMPMRKIVGILNEVGFSAFSRIQSDHREVGDKLLQAVRSIAIVSFPVFLGIAAVAQPVTDLFLGEKWLEVAVPLALLSLTIPLRLTNTTTATMLHGIGRADVAAQNSLIALLLLTPAFAVASMQGDIVIVCLVWVTIYPVHYLICLARALPRIELRYARYLQAIWKSAVAAIVMLAVVYSLSIWAGEHISSQLTLLIALIAVGGLLYVGLMLATARSQLTDLINLFR